MCHPHRSIRRCPQHGRCRGRYIDGRDRERSIRIGQRRHVDRRSIGKQPGPRSMFLLHVATRIGENPCWAYARGPVRRKNVRVGGRALIPLNGDGAPRDTAEGGCVRHEPGHSENKNDDCEDRTDDDLLIQGIASEVLRIARSARRTTAFPVCARWGRGLVARSRRAGCRRGSRRPRDERAQDWLQRRGDARLPGRSAL